MTKLSPRSLAVPLACLVVLLTFILVVRGAAMFELRTTAFATGSEIPNRFTCRGADQSPALSWSSAPAKTRSFALIVDDPDAPSGTFTHWLIYAIPANARGLGEATPTTERLTDGSRQGRNGFGRIGYGGPCPPPGKRHRYFFKLYALDTEITIPAGASRAELERAMAGHSLAEAEVIGTYQR